MDSVFRVCIAGRFFDIPTHEISPATLEALKAITDNANTINPRDLLVAFLESHEAKHALESDILAATRKLLNAKASH